MNPQVANFFREIINRLRTKSPKFFIVLQIFAAALTFAGKFPVWVHKYTSFVMSSGLVEFCNDLGNIAIGFLTATLLSAETKPLAVTEEGNVLKKLDEQKYPFTATVEQKKAEEAETPVVKDPLPNE